MQATNLTGGRIDNATRINAACWLDGNDDEIVVEFWYMSGSILRTQYDRRSTIHTIRFLNVHLEADAFRRMVEMYEGQLSTYSI